MKQHSPFSARRSPLAAFWSKYGIGILFFTPMCVLFFVFVVFPVLISIGMSLTNYDMLQTPQFVGLENYKQLFLDDEIFLTALKNTMIFGGGFLSCRLSGLLFHGLGHQPTGNAEAVCSGVLCALHYQQRGHDYGMAVFFSPDRHGLINNCLLDLGLIQTPILWNQDSSTILPVVILIQIWMSMGTGFLVFFGPACRIFPEISARRALSTV